MFYTCFTVKIIKFLQKFQNILFYGVISKFICQNPRQNLTMYILKYISMVLTNTFRFCIVPQRNFQVTSFRAVSLGCAQIEFQFKKLVSNSASLEAEEVFQSVRKLLEPQHLCCETNERGNIICSLTRNTRRLRNLAEGLLRLNLSAT